MFQESHYGDDDGLFYGRMDRWKCMGAQPKVFCVEQLNYLGKLFGAHWYFSINCWV